MYVKLAFAVSAHLDSEILVMDEVLAVGDMKFQDKCLEKMKDVATGEGRTVLYVSHNMSTIKRLCNRCIVLDHGSKIFDGDVMSAIDVYSNHNAKEFSPLKIFEPAPYWDYYMRQIQMLSFELMNTSTDEYVCGDMIEGVLRCHSDVNFDNVRLRIEVFNGVDTLLGIYESDRFPTFQKEKESNLLIKIPTTGLSGGRYKINFALYNANSEGMSTTIDLAREAIQFTLREDFEENRIIGDYRNGGFIRLGTPEVKKI
jgi:lipopolysaccharide transport system ATP-binding protein